MATEKDWRDSKTSTECLSHLCLSETMSDIVFTFPDSDVRLYAHKFLLSMRSAVFEAMFYGPVAERGQEVKIEDIDPDTFEVLLRYIYTDTIDLTESTVLMCLYVGQKYFIDGFVQACLTFLEKSFCVDNVLVLYEQAYGLGTGMADLQQRCMRFIALNADHVLRSEELLAISDKTLVTLLDRDDLNAEEKSIFEAAVKWAKHQCAKKGEDESPDNIRRYLGDAFHRIRLPTMTIQDFTDTVLPSQLLSKTEETQLHRYIANAANEGGENTDVGKHKVVKRKPRITEVLLERRARVKMRCKDATPDINIRITSSAPVKLHSISGSMFRHGVRELKKNGLAIATEKWYVEGNRLIIAGGVEVNTTGGKTDIQCVLLNNHFVTLRGLASDNSDVCGGNVITCIRYGLYTNDKLKSLTFMT